jgi:phosphoribosylformimino-5-aminoimidazole carboxamide ribotide isomerase
VVAADVRDGRIVRKGWTEDTPIQADAFLATLAPLPLAGALCTDVGREGRLGGIDETSVRSLIRASPVPVWISGGITTMQDLEFLASEGAGGAVLGMSIYTGVLDPDAVAKAWGS